VIRVRGARPKAVRLHGRSCEPLGADPGDRVVASAGRVGCGAGRALAEPVERGVTAIGRDIDEGV